MTARPSTLSFMDRFGRAGAVAVAGIGIAVILGWLRGWNSVCRNGPGSSNKA